MTVICNNLKKIFVKIFRRVHLNLYCQVWKWNMEIHSDYILSKLPAERPEIWLYEQEVRRNVVHGIQNKINF